MRNLTIHINLPHDLIGSLSKDFRLQLLHHLPPTSSSSSDSNFEINFRISTSELSSSSGHKTAPSSNQATLRIHNEKKRWATYQGMLETYRDGLNKSNMQSNKTISKIARLERRMTLQERETEGLQSYMEMCQAPQTDKKDNL
ncbi:uncharacterized protein LOC119350351 [Triticum dicoccoides]|uniref:uncharacterized protein LOC119350351 n=1 Tax=Triticum dicoccoides TaxID=85692 RepID=UPI0018906D2C|nr:uncharacterized protein LOC119350351 [Triticum dicoccoides]